MYYNHYNTGRPSPEDRYEKYCSNYLDEINTPLYPFGYGLSYTQFTYSDIKLSPESINADGEIIASVTVKNIGKRDGTEVVQLYVRDMVGSVVRPVKELRGFERIQMKAGESKTVMFTITPETLKFYNANLDFVTEPGEFDIMIGGNSRDVKSVKFVLR